MHIIGKFKIRVWEKGESFMFRVTLQKWGVADQTNRGRGLCLLNQPESVPVTKGMVAAAFAQIPNRLCVGSFECEGHKKTHYTFGPNGIMIVDQKHNVPEDLIGGAFFERVG